MRDLVIAAFIEARLTEDEIWAREASRDQRGDVPTGAHWQWVETRHDEEIVPDPSASEMLETPDGWSSGQALRSVEHFPSSVGALPQFAISTVEEVRSAVAGHIIRHDPARVLREVEAKRRILERHRVLVEYDREADAKPHELKAEKWRATSTRTQLLYVLEALASAWSDHPDFKPEWRAGA